MKPVGFRGEGVKFGAQGFGVQGLGSPVAEDAHSAGPCPLSESCSFIGGSYSPQCRVRLFLPLAILVCEKSRTLLSNYGYQIESQDGH